MAATTTKPVTMKTMAAEQAEEHEMSRKQLEGIYAGFVSGLVRNLKQGHKVRIPGFGIFQVKKRAARMGRNPATGEQIQIKASKKVTMRVSKELKEAV